ncbi:hypothetical protein FIBSPDRAFT_860048 [Athelia psychrophila]|uniref:F-box domain-containing protein n=1 Tax=Athelia psychrophila TaxID=1759441 RepID=A0A166KHG6_9AGAM|nr:hypothetical protein FIBSPDRAFT_860048 [Fibularhizoctonia sp. CBS 109695]
MSADLVFKLSCVASAVIKRLTTTYDCYAKLLKNHLHLLLLPLELLGEIAGHLPWLDLLHLRMTCKLLCDVSKLRSVRVSLVDRAIASDPYGTPLERPIGRYSGEDVEQGWVSSRRDDICARKVLLGATWTKPLDATCLITGGRWLLGVIRGGIITAMDLDDPNASHQVLVEPQDEFDMSPALSLCFSIIDGATTLTFDLAIMHYRPYALEDYPHSRLCVWRVVLSDDGTNLIAHHVKSIWTKHVVAIKERSFSFSGNRFARRLTIPNIDVSSLEVFDWRQSTSYLHHTVTFRLQPPAPTPLFFQLISGNRALVVSDECLWIYAIPELQATTNLTVTNPSNITAIHTIPLWGGGVKLGGLSRPCKELLQTVVVLFTSSGIYRLDIPDDVDSSPVPSIAKQFDPVMKFEPGCFGLNRGLLCMSRSLFMTVCYENPSSPALHAQDGRAMTRQYTWPKGQRASRSYVMDEGSGRILQPSGSGIVFIFDFSLYKHII